MGFLAGARAIRLYIGYRRRGVPHSVLKNSGPGFTCGWGAFFRQGEDIRIGSNVYLGNNVHIAAPCSLGNDVLIASNVALVGGDHRFDIPGTPIKGSGRGEMPGIIIEDDVWVGHGAIVLCGVRIRRGSIVAAGSVVTKSIPACTIWAGNPAAFLRNRFISDEQKLEHLTFLENRHPYNNLA